MKKIMIIEDDSVIRNELQTLLKNNGYEVVIEIDFSDVESDIKEQMPHLIILDINLPGENGYSICSSIRAFSNVPIIFVTSRNTDMDELNSFIFGGDDFITKPYKIPNLLARISSVLKRVYPLEQEDIREYKGVKLYLDKGVMDYQEQSIELTKNEFKILCFLFKNAGKIVSRASIIEYLWDNQLYIDDNALSVYITRIRAKLKEIGLVDFIKTKYRQGYII